MILAKNTWKQLSLCTPLLVLIGCGSVPEKRSSFTLTTGNGHGFQLYDVRKNQLTAFLDHPYRYVTPAKDLRQFGQERRNLLLEFDVGAESPNGPTAWLSKTRPESAEYLDESNIISVRLPGAERYLFAPFTLPQNAWVSLTKFSQPTIARTKLGFHLGHEVKSDMFWESPFKVGLVPGEKVEELQGLGRPAWMETGKTPGALLYVALEDSEGSCQPSCQSEQVLLELKSREPTLWSGVVVAYVENPRQVRQKAREIVRWIDQQEAASLLQRERAAWAQWRKPPPVALQDEAERKLWRQSEAVLRMGQVLETNGPKRSNHGMILASLPPGGWSIAWVRDGIYATVALIRAGHFEEARKSLDFFLNAHPVGLFKEHVDNVPYRISVTRYYGNGQEESDYAGHNSPNIETDGWGLFLWAARQYVEASGDHEWLKRKTRQGRVYQVLRDEVARPIESQLEPDPRIMKPDSSIWEAHQENAKHFIYSSLTAARGLCDFAWLAALAAEQADQRHYARLSEQVRTDIGRAFVVDGGYLVGARERTRETDLDAALVEAFSLDVIPDFNSDLARKTFAHLQKLKLPHGGYKRTGGVTDYEINEWAFVNYRMANAFLRLGQPEKARALIERMTLQAKENFNLLPEMFDAVDLKSAARPYTGSIPMTGYGAGAFMLSVLEREGSFEKRDCGITK
ncbi:MAG: hypothetical protein KF802_15890 [Bdellovibrionaceae bacterium]|nr:hypothetical protein [Pseudobdellovibrionaceae bacterium]